MSIDRPYESDRYPLPERSVDWPPVPFDRGWTPAAWPQPRPRPQRLWLHTLLFLLTLGTTTWAGVGHYAAFLSAFNSRPIQADASVLLGGFWYSLTILAILGAHEMGHYVACRYYRVDATLPFFIPAFGILTGTFGAIIRIRQPILTKRALFDIGIAGPIAGFLVAVPALFVGLTLSDTAPLPENFAGLELGEPLLFQWAVALVWPHIPSGETLNMHPMTFAAWFGLLATALNLFPVAQLDGGHISYAVFGRRSTFITIGMLGVAIALTFVSLSWLVWTLMIIVMLFVAGPHHPPTLDADIEIDTSRKWLAFGALLMFLVCFTPAPIEFFELID